MLLSYKQNVNNFFENLLGECANIKSLGIGFYFERRGNIKRWEVY